MEPQKPAAVEAPAAPVAQPAAAPPDNAIVDRLLADFAEKNAEILRLNNELTQIKYEVREKEQKISALTSIEAVLDQKEEAIKGKDAVIKDKEESIKDKEATIKDKEAALKEKDAILKEKEALLKEIEAALTAKDNEIKAYEVKVMELEARMSEMAEQLGTLRKFSNRESGHEPYVEPATLPGEKQEINVQEKMTSQEDDVASIFRRLAEAKVETGGRRRQGAAPPAKVGQTVRPLTAKCVMGTKRAILSLNQQSWRASIPWRAIRADLRRGRARVYECLGCTCDRHHKISSLNNHRKLDSSHIPYFPDVARYGVE